MYITGILFICLELIIWTGARWSLWVGAETRVVGNEYVWTYTRTVCNTGVYCNTAPVYGVAWLWQTEGDRLKFLLCWITNFRIISRHSFFWRLFRGFAPSFYFDNHGFSNYDLFFHFYILVNMVCLLCFQCSRYIFLFSLSQHELVWQHERTRFLDKVWQLEMEVADLRATSKVRCVTISQLYLK